MQGPEVLGEENLYVAIAGLFLDNLSPGLSAVSPRVGAIRLDPSMFLKAAESIRCQESWHRAKAVLRYIEILAEAMLMLSEY